MIPRSRAALGLALAAVLVSGPMTATAGPATPTDPPAMLSTEPVYDYKSAIRETAYVTATAVDGDRDGKPDKIAADIIRPAGVAPGVKVPVIMLASPYFKQPLSAVRHDRRALEPADDPDAKDPQDDGSPSRFPDWYDNYFVPRGYAVVLVDMPGTRASEGCLTSGGKSEVLGTKAVVDWIGGRTTAVNKAGQQVKADWSTGKVGMVGRSWRGTVANAIATLDAPNLATIVPISAISSWYDYMRKDGQNKFKDHPRWLASLYTTRVEPQVCTPITDEIAEQSAEKTGNYNAFWHERNYAKDAGKVKTSVFMVHGLNDWNVQMKHAQGFWQGLQPSVPKKLWLHQVSHVDPVYFRGPEWISTLHRWFDYWLYGVQNGIMTEPQVSLEQSPGKWVSAPSWPSPKAVNQQLWFTPASTTGGPGGLTGAPSAQTAEASFTDSIDTSARNLAAGPDQVKPNRLAFVTKPLTRDVRISGVVSVALKAKVTAGGGPLSAFLVDYGPSLQVAHDSADGYQNGTVLDGEQCIGRGDDIDTGCVAKRKQDVRAVDHEVVAEGWMNTTHRESVLYQSEVVPGRVYDFRWSMQAEDFVLKAGHRLGIVVTGTDCSEAEEGCDDMANGNQPWPAATVTLDVTRSSVTLPVVQPDAG